MDTTEEEKAAEPKPLPKLKRMHARFVDKYFLRSTKFNGTEAYMLANPSVTRGSARRLATVLLARPDIQAHIAARWAELKMTEDAIVSDLSEQSQAAMYLFYKPCERWTFHPLPTHEIIAEREVADTRPGYQGKIRIEYQVRYLAIDITKVMDPNLSHLIKKFSDSPRTGYTIELYDRQAAEDKILRTLGAYKDKIALTDPNGGNLIPPNDKEADAQYNRAISSLADAFRTLLPGTGSETQSDMDTAK